MLIFNYPTNDDHGIFQCLAYNAKQYKQSTTDVLISREGVSNNTATGKLLQVNCVVLYKIVTLICSKVD